MNEEVYKEALMRDNRSIAEILSNLNDIGIHPKEEYCVVALQDELNTECSQK